MPFCGPRGKDYWNRSVCLVMGEDFGCQSQAWALRQKKCKDIPSLFGEWRPLDVGLIWACVPVSRQCPLFVPKQEFQVGELVWGRAWCNRPCFHRISRTALGSKRCHIGYMAVPLEVWDRALARCELGSGFHPSYCKTTATTKWGHLDLIGPFWHL